MQEHLKFYIDGEWVDPATPATLDVINPTTEAPFATISMGSAADVEKAVAAAKTAFESFSKTSVQERMELLGAILGEYTKRYDEIAAAISTEMGAPIWLSKAAQAATGQAHFATTLELLKTYAWEEKKGAYLLRKEPVGVCGLITPWNWPINQISCKVAPALAAGCTMVLKPSEVAPVNAILLAEILDAAGVPKGVFNLVNGDGPSVGEAMSSHPDIHMMSFTGSTRAGVLVAKAAADTVKRVSQELGGKSANIVLEDADLQTAVAGGVSQVMTNSGQSCNAPTRMLVPKAKHDEALQIAKAAAEGVKPGDPFTDGTVIGPVVSEVQFEKIQGLIQKGIDEGATLVAGGTGRPDGLNAGYFVKPTVFGDVNNDMTIAREEIFGPVLSILPYETEAEAIEIANDTPYGLSGYVQSGSVDHAVEVASQIRTGNVHINGSGPDFGAPFGGYKQSGNGREWGELGFEEFLETKAMFVPAA
ncbi:aldehyde dehydrogenase family protein [Pseudomonadales bacterium]|jgi:aldehyde dehydrogenase (NAD+)|nr:aldehyde dehydrogenase family protein [Gammaproteobacteria bacterium]MDA7754691.1 aldehyde dehydrogenase family protein [Pseudomonadales bacterium]MBT3736612.1 aldehyde dehydrogenase family protein [Gammaproteobacteria bacterium]MBT3900755.1 aldehyde dehydrogenase family protein [Gammaproteobacteria bacterium]MBT7541497.1 aldehyde dehydrogenase family protein [Gammaproteobacteria bacterium]|tara:strand:+ start:9900 stop:11327 length:1428 start_codon:yes stop_codon:yes gene_type:complete